MKKIISVFLCVAIIFTFGSTAFASNSISDNEANIMREAAEIQEEIPNAEVRVVDGVLHIVVDDYSDVPWFNAAVQSSRTTSVVSSSGGSFREFDIPWYAPDGARPYSQVYMNKDVVDALKLQMTEPTICKWIVDQIGQGLTAAAVAALAYSVWGISITSGVVSVIASFLYWVVSNLEYWSLKSAQDSSTTGKVSVVRCLSPQGNYSYIYSAWNNNICTTYCNYDAVWYAGEYDV